MLQIAVEPMADIPAESCFADWVGQTLALSDTETHDPACVTIRLVDSSESADLNGRYRGKSTPTNVLAFPAGEPVSGLPAGEDRELGDLVMCLEVVCREAAEQAKQLEAHFAHLAVHGTLHLVGYDHQDDAQADVMESLEKRILETLGFADPYAADIGINTQN